MPNTWITELADKRNRAIKEAQDIAGSEELSGERKQAFERAVERAEDLNETLEGAKRLERMGADGEKMVETISEVSGMLDAGEAPGVKPAPDHGAQLRRMSETKGRSGKVNLRFDNYMEWRNQIDDGATPRDIVERALTTASDSGGPAIPTGVEARFFDVLLNINGIRKAGAEVWTTTSGNQMNLPFSPDLNTAPPTAVATVGENASIADIDVDLAAIQTQPVKVAGLVNVTREIMQDSSPRVDSMIGDRLGRDIAWKAEALYNLAAGAIGDAVTDGFFVSGPARTGTTTITTATTGTLTYGLMVQTKYAVDDYPMASTKGNCWVMRKATLGSVLRLEGSDGHPIFVMGNGLDVPDRILGDRVVYNNFAGNLATAGAYAIGYGDFGGYLIRDVGTVEIDYDESVGFREDVTVFRAILRTTGKIINPQLFSFLRSKS